MRKHRPAKVPTAQSLANIALYYLARFSASESSLRRTLENRIQRASLRLPEFAADHSTQAKLREAIDKIVETHKKTGAINDVAFAEMKVHSLRRQGRSRRAIEQKLALKGIRGEILYKALLQNADGAEPEEIELKAAMNLARRRKWGPFRKALADEDKKRKEFAALARAGFSSSIVRKVLGAAPEDTDFFEE